MVLSFALSTVPTNVLIWEHPDDFARVVEEFGG